MDSYRKLGTMLAALAAEGKAIPLFNAEVISVEDESCTIDVNGLHVDEVRLKATINGSSNKIMITPKIGSMVLVGSLTDDLKDLAVVNVDEVAKLEYVQDGLNITVDSNDGKIKVSNSSADLKNVLQQLADLLKQLKVYTPAGPSGTPLPDTIIAIEQFETSFKQLLK